MDLFIKCLIEKIYVSEMFANEDGVYLSSVQNSEERRLIYQLTKICCKQMRED